MAKITLKDLPGDMKIDEKELRNIRGGFLFTTTIFQDFYGFGAEGPICKKQSALLGGFNMDKPPCKKMSSVLGGI